MTNSEAAKKARELIRGAIDLHVHSGPDVFPRIGDDCEIATAAREAKMGGLLIKSHVTSTADRAQVAGRITGFPVFGGLALNQAVGGLNPEAVEISARLGAKIIWLPTIDAANPLASGDQVAMFKVLDSGRQGKIKLLDQGGKPIEAAREVLALIARNRMVLATGHVDKNEAAVLVVEARKAGVEKILLTHPLSPLLGYSIPEIKAMLERGVTWVELSFFDTTSLIKNPIQPGLLAEAAAAIGTHRAIMTSDSGQIGNLTPVQSFFTYIEAMLKEGLDESAIGAMSRENPSKLLDLA